MDGKVTDLRKAVQANGDETIVFSGVWWPDTATCDAAEKIQLAIFGGFTPILDTAAA